MNIRTRTFQIDWALHLHDPICAFPLSLDNIDIRYQPHKPTTPTRSLLSSIESDLVRTTTIGAPAAICVNGPGLRERIAPCNALDVTRRGVVDDSV